MRDLQNQKTLLVLLSIVLTISMVRIGRTEPPLFERVDRWMAEIYPGPEMEPCGDGEFLRRIYLDLVGHIPSANQAREFIDSTDADKRTKVIDELLASEAYSKHLANVMDIILMERRPHKYVKAEPWSEYLLASAKENKAWNLIAREILSADGTETQPRGPAKFYLEREVEANLLTREVGRMFFGMDLQCAQCHDHPLIDDYVQSDYYGLFAFVSRSYLFQPDKKKPAVIAEKAEGDAKFKSVFTEEEGETLPRLPGNAEITEPAIKKGDEYQVKPDPKKKNIRPVPRYSRRQQLAIQATNGSNAAFNRNIVNRLWAHMMGRGLVHPVDQHHSSNPPVHPELLNGLATEFAASGFDVKRLLRQLALTNTYQRQFELPNDMQPHADAAAQLVTVWQSKIRQLETRVEQLANEELNKQGQLARAQQQLPELEKLQAEASKRLSESRELADSLAEPIRKLKESLANQTKADELLTSAIRDANQAIDILIDGGKLADSIQSLAKRQTALRDTLAKLDQKLQGLTKQSADAVKQKSTAEAAMRQAVKQIEQTRQSIRQLENEVSQAGRQTTDARTHLTAARRQRDRYALMNQFGQSLQQRKTVSEELAQQQSRFALAEKQLKTIVDQIASKQSELAEAESKHQKLVVKKSNTEKEHATKSAAAKLLAASNANAKQAAEILENDPSIASVQQTVQRRIEQLTVEIDQLAVRVKSIRSETDAATKTLAMVRNQIASLTQQQTALTKMIQESPASIEEFQQRLAKLDEQIDAQRDQVTAAWSRQFAISILQPLSPEQLAWSLLKSTDYEDRIAASVRASVEKKNPPKKDGKEDPAKVAERENEIAKQTESKLNSMVARFVRLFAAAAGQPQDGFFATVDQALFFRNGGEIRSWLSPSSGNLTDRLIKLEQPKAVAEELYLSLLTRFPTTQETQEIVDYLSSAKEKRSQAIQEMAWAMISSAEFRFHH